MDSASRPPCPGLPPPPSVLSEEPGPLHLFMSLEHPFPQGPRRAHWSNGLSWVSLDKEQGGEGGGGLEEPTGSSPFPATLPRWTVQAVGWPAWPFRALILARK